jgi:hypothetical protein
MKNHYTISLIAQLLLTRLDFMSNGMRDEQGKPIQVNLEGLLASDPELSPKVLEEINLTAKYMLWNKARYEISLRANLIGDKMDVDVNRLLRALMEGEGEEVEKRNTSSSSFGMVDWGYFYDPQVVDSASQIILEGEQQPGSAGADGNSMHGVSTHESSTLAGAAKFNAQVPVHHGQSYKLRVLLAMELTPPPPDCSSYGSSLWIPPPTRQGLISYVYMSAIFIHLAYIDRSTVTYQAFSTIFVRLPYWVIIYLPKYWRPRPSWSLKRCVMVCSCLTCP